VFTRSFSTFFAVPTVAHSTITLAALTNGYRVKYEKIDYFNARDRRRSSRSRIPSIS
jgi:hypothetical protein